MPLQDSEVVGTRYTGPPPEQTDADGWRSKLATQVAGATAQQRDLQGPPAARLATGGMFLFVFSLVSFLTKVLVMSVRFKPFDTKTHDLVSSLGLLYGLCVSVLKSGPSRRR